MHAGVLPIAFSQLGALSASTAGVVLVALEGGRAGVRELLSRGFVWRVGFKWWAVAILCTGIIAAASIYLAAVIDGIVDWSALVIVDKSG
jgi:hypothetical protein